MTGGAEAARLAAVTSVIAWRNEHQAEVRAMSQLWDMVTADQRNAEMRRAYRRRQLARRRRGRR